MLVMLMQSAAYNMRDLFLPGMPGLKLQLYRFDMLLHEHAPGVRQHIKDLADDASMPITPLCQLFAVEWFMCIFCSINLAFGLHVWDRFIRHGWPAVFRHALAVVLRHRDALLKIKNLGTVVQVLTSSKIFEHDMPGVISLADGLRSKVNASVLGVLADMYYSSKRLERRQELLQRPKRSFTVNKKTSRRQRNKKRRDSAKKQQNTTPQATSPHEVRM